MNGDQDAKIAYFSMEIALEPRLKTYSGGLGVLAGDTLRAAADLGAPMVGVTLVHRKGYVAQRVDAQVGQIESPDPWQPEAELQETQARVQVSLAGRAVTLRAFRYSVVGVSGSNVPVLLLDADVAENHPDDRGLTDTLYGGDERYRLAQEAILGIGGVRMLRALGYEKVTRFHMNEGHAALLTLELLDEAARARSSKQFGAEDVARVREQCVFTTHTPVPAGHDQFPLSLVREVLERQEISDMHELFCCDDLLNMTHLALNFSHYVNGVALRHSEVAQHLLEGHMFPAHRVNAITNGIHVATWACDAFRALYDRYLPAWRSDNFLLRYALRVPRQAVWSAHQTAKNALLEEVERLTSTRLDREAFTIGFARRATAYKRPLLLLHSLERLQHIAKGAGPLQILYGGKAHPRDEGGKHAIREILSRAGQLGSDVRVVYLENYEMELAARLVSGVDLWVNTPRPPLEASGTSGMKAAINGVPTLSVLDGWWLEGHVEGVTGWSIGARDAPWSAVDVSDARDAEELYDKLEHVILPLFQQRLDDYIEVMRFAMALTGSFFNTQRMLQQYIANAYLE